MTKLSCLGIIDIPNCNEAAKTTALVMVPNPGVTRSGIQTNSTKQLTKKKAQPSGISN